MPMDHEPTMEHRQLWMLEQEMQVLLASQQQQYEQQLKKQQQQQGQAMCHESSHEPHAVDPSASPAMMSSNSDDANQHWMAPSLLLANKNNEEERFLQEFPKKDRTNAFPKPSSFGLGLNLTPATTMMPPPSAVLKNKNEAANWPQQSQGGNVLASTTTELLFDMEPTPLPDATSTVTPNYAVDNGVAMNDINDPMDFSFSFNYDSASQQPADLTWVAQQLGPAGVDLCIHLFK